MDQDLLTRWADRAGLADPVSGADVVHGWGDMEVAFAVKRDEGSFVVVKESRGSWSTLGRFASQEDADAFLLVCFAAVWRANERLGDVFPADPAPDSALSQGDGGWVAAKGTHRAEFAHRSDAKRYTYVAGKSLAQVDAFMRA